MDQEPIIDAEAIRKVIESQRDEIFNAVVNGIKKQAEESLSWQIKQDISKVVSEVFESEIREEIRAMLLEQKPAILSASQEAVISFVATLGQTMLKDLTERLGTDYRRREIMKAIFG